jgi:hypothetical protein
VKTTMIIALSAAALIAAAPAVLAQNASSKISGQQHKVFKKRPQVVADYAPWHVVHANDVKTGYPGASSAPKDSTYDNSRNGGGGGGGFGGGM